MVTIICDFSKLCIDSVILTQEEQEFLISIIDSQSETKQLQYAEWHLLCRGSRDGVKQKAFHDACDGQKHTVCLLDVNSTGYVCGGYASTAGASTRYNTRAKDDNAFLFVLRPVEARKVCSRKRDDETGKLVRPDGGVLHNRGDGFNC